MGCPCCCSVWGRGPSATGHSLVPGASGGGQEEGVRFKAQCCDLEGGDLGCFCRSVLGPRASPASCPGAAGSVQMHRRMFSHTLGCSQEFCHDPVCIPIPLSLSLRGYPVSSPMAWHSPWLQGQGTHPCGNCSVSYPIIPPSPSSCSTLPLLFFILIAIIPFLCIFFFFFNFWDLSFQFNLLISVLISLCRLFADFTRHNFYQLVLKDA